MDSVSRVVLESPRLQCVRKGVPGRPLVLVVEDDADDRDFVTWAFQECTDPVDLVFAEDGEEALAYLTGFAGDGETRRRPSLILLDLNIPKVSGSRLLDRVRRDPCLRKIPIVVFTGSDDPGDVERAYGLGANSYFTKPDTMDGFRNVIRILENYWLREAELPRS